MKNKFFLLKTALILSFLPFLLHAQTDEKIYDAPEVQAEFPDGQAALFQFLKTSLKYQKPNTSITIKFTVEKNGTVQNIELRDRRNNQLIEANSDFIKAFQKIKWKPGKQKGKAVRSYFIIPIGSPKYEE